MNPMSYLTLMFEVCALLFICSAVGKRCAALLPQLVQETLQFYVSPLLGLACLVLVVTLYGWLTPFKASLSILIAIGLTTASIVFEQQKKQFFIEWLQVCAFAMACSLPIMASIIHFNGYNPFTDIFTYLVHGQWLQSHAFSEKMTASGYYPAFTQVTIYQHAGSRMGGSFFLGYVQSLFALSWSYYAYIPSITLPFVAGCLAIGGIIRQVVPVKKIIILALAAIPCFSKNGFVFGAQWGFFPQTFGLAFAVGIFAILPMLIQDVVNNHYSFRRIALSVLPVSICTAALLFAYNEPFPIFAAALFLFFLITLVLYRSKAIIVLFSAYAIELLVLMNYEIVRMARNILQTLTISNGQAAIGWPVYWAPIQFLAYAFGFKSTYDNAKYSHYLSSVILFSIFFICLCLLLFYFVRKGIKNKLALIFLFCIELVFLLCFIKFRYLSSNGNMNEMGYTFLQYKIAKYASPFSLALVGIVAALLWYDKAILRPLLVFMYVTVMIVGFKFHFYQATDNLTNNYLDEVKQRHYPFDRLLELRSAIAQANISSNDTIYVALGQQHSKLRQMVAYILSDRKIAGDYTDDGYLLGQLPIDERVMSPKNVNWFITIAENSASCEKTNQQVGPFVIRHAPLNYVAQEKNEGAYNTESNDKGDTWNWVNHAVDYYFNNIGEGQNIKVSFKLIPRPVSTPRSFIIDLQSLNGTVLARYKLTPKSDKVLFDTEWVHAKSDHFKLHVEASGEPAQLSEHDTRTVKFAIANIEVCAKNSNV